MIRHSERSRPRTTVLVASASPLFERRASQLLQDSGYVTACAFEWEAAWLSVTRTRPGIVLVDGASAAGHVQGIAVEAAARGIPVLLAHAAGDPLTVQDAARARTPDASVVLLPATKHTLRAALEGLFDRHDGHAMRCPPTTARRGTRMHDTPQSVRPAVGVDGMVEHLAPPPSAAAAIRGVIVGVRRWWDDVMTAATAGRAAASRPKG